MKPIESICKRCPMYRETKEKQFVGTDREYASVARKCLAHCRSRKVCAMPCEGINCFGWERLPENCVCSAEHAVLQKE